MSIQSSSDHKTRAEAEETVIGESPARPGLRERKKQQTRLTISAVATRLFIERGFDHVTVAEVAEAAGVSVNTIFNYFTTKEDLFFDRGDEVVGATAQMIRKRQPGESLLAALERGLQIKGSEPFNGTNVLAFIATINASPALQERERALVTMSEASLAEALYAEPGISPDDPTPRLVAALITAFEWTIVREFRTRLLRGESEAKIQAALKRTTKLGFALLKEGIAGYGTTSGT